MNGGKSKQGFYQKLIVQANGPDQARLLATTRVWHDPDLAEMTLNAKDDPPKIQLKTIWELDLVDDPDELAPDRFFYEEYKWWQLGKRRREQKRLLKYYSEMLNHEQETKPL